MKNGRGSSGSRRAPIRQLHFIQPLCLGALYQRPVVEPGDAAGLKDTAPHRDEVRTRIDLERVTRTLPIVRPDKLHEIIGRDQLAELVGLVDGGEGVTRLSLIGHHARLTMLYNLRRDMPGMPDDVIDHGLQIEMRGWF